MVSLKARDWAWNDVTNILIPAGSGADVRPVAVISPVIAAGVETLVPLDGSQSYDLNGDLLTWDWSLIWAPPGSTAELSATDAPRVGFEPDEPGLYIVQLQVSGGGQTSKPVTVPVIAGSPLPYADAGRDQLVDFDGNAEVDSSASVADVTNRRWKVLRISDASADTVIGNPNTASTSVTVARRNWLFHNALNSSSVYHFADRPIDAGWCGYDIRRPDDIPGANPAEPITISLAAQGQYWGTLGLSQVWEVENEGEYTRVVTLVDEDSTVYGTYTIPGGISLFVATPDTAARELTVEVGGTGVAAGYGSASPFSNSNLVCTGPAYDVLQVTVENAGGFSLPDTVFVGSGNIRPVLDRPADIAAGQGATVALTGTDYSFDANGAALTWSWALLHRPTGSAALLDGQPVGTVITASDVEISPDVAGLYLVMLTAHDSEFMSEPMVLVIGAGASGNRPPVLEPLDPLYTVEAGLTLTIPLIGSDPDGDPISYFVSPLPLPAGFTLDANSGEIRFTPSAAQIGTYTFNVGVSDGALTDQATLNIEVTAATALDTGVSGIVRDAVTDAPLSGIPVRLRDAALSTTTDANGAFSFAGLTAGSDQVLVEPSATGGPGGYAGVVRSIRIVADQEIPLVPDFLLTPLGDGCANVVAGVPTVLTGTSNGVTVTILADSINASGGGAYTGSVCLGSLPELFAVEGLPQDTQACRVYALDAPGAVFTQGISVVAPNVDGLPETTILDYWQVNPLNGLFRPAATAGVDSGAMTVSSNVTSFSSSTLFAFLPRAPQLVSSADQPTGNRSYSVFDGNMSETYRLPVYRAFNRDQQVGLTYNSETANPTIIVAGDVTIRATDSLPVGLTTRIDVGGLSISDDAAWTPREGLDGATPALVGEAVTLRQSMAVDALGLASGRYGYNFVARAKYDCSTVSTTHAADIYIRNDSESPYGKGWMIEGLQELVIGDDGRVSIYDDKGVSTFNPQPTLTEFDGDPLIFPSVGTQRVNIDDYDGDGYLDVAYGSSGTGSARIVRGLGGRDMVYDREIVFADPNTVPPTGTYTPNLLTIYSGDLGNDGSPDLGYGLQLQDRVGYLANDGFGGFTDVTILAASMAVRDVAILDLDGDGYDDFLYLNRSGLVTNEVQVAYGSATGLAAPVRAGSRAQTGSPIQFEIGDVDGNGLPDIAWRLSTGGMTFLFQTAPRTFTVVVPSPAIGPNPINLLGEYFQLADFNGDGKLDVVWSGTDNLTVYINANTTGRTFLAGVSLARPPSASTAMYVHAADANGDGLPDIVASLGSSVVVYLSNGDGTFQPFEEGFVDYPISDVAFADIDGDGSLDMVSGQRFTVRVHFSKPSASGNFVGGAGEFSELTALPGGGWERRYKDGNIIIFDTEGRQTAEVDPQGNSRQFAYDVDGRLLTITDQVGGVTTFAYGLLGRLDTITYPDGRVTSFTYDDEAGALASITEPSPESGTVSFAYDENGLLISTTNQNGNTTGYSYDATGRLSGSNLPDGSSIRTQIGASIGLVDAFGSAAVSPLKFIKPEDRITVAVDRKGGETEIEVNEFGSIVRTTDPIGRVTLLDRDGGDLVAAITRPNESLPGGTRRDEMTYDARGNITTLIEAAGTALQRTTNYEYEPVFSKVTLVTDPAGFETVYEYDPTGLVVRIEDSEGEQQLFTYTTAGQLESRIDENGNQVSYEYGTNGNVSIIALPNNSTTELTYDFRGYVTEISEAAGTIEERRIVRSFDALGRLETTTFADAAGTPTAGFYNISYDPVGNQISLTDQTGVTTTAEYDSLERLHRLDSSIEGLIQINYNLAGEMVAFIDGAGRSYQYEYDEVSRLIIITAPDASTRAFSYDNRNNTISVIDARNSETIYHYDGLNRVTQRINPLAFSKYLTHDALDNIISVTHEDSTVETRGYDKLSRIISITTPTETIQYSYDPAGNMIAASDDDSGIQNTFNSLNLLSSTSTSGGVGPQPASTLTFTYDLLGRRSALIDSLGGNTTYGWTNESWLNRITTPSAQEFIFSYDVAGRRVGIVSNGGRETTYEYDDGLLSAIANIQGASTLHDFVFQYTEDGLLQSTLNQLLPASPIEVTYDDIRRIAGVSEGLTPTVIESYEYDANSNWTETLFSNIFTHNSNNQILEDAYYSYAYDNRGNRISRTAKGGGAVEEYTYDSLGRLSGYSSPTTDATYYYDAIGRRISKNVNGAVSTYVYDLDHDNSLAADSIVLEFYGTPTSVDLLRRWSHSNRIDEPVAFEAYTGSDAPGAGTTHLLYADRMGSILSVIELPSESEVAEYEYSAFGATSQISGSYRQPFGYIGRELDTESGLYYMRARHYDPQTGSFLQPDPIEFSSGTLNLYAYAFGNPLAYADHSGLASAGNVGITAGTIAMSQTVTGTVGVGVMGAVGRIVLALQAASNISEMAGIGHNNPPSESDREWCQQEYDYAMSEAGKRYGICMQIAATVPKASSRSKLEAQCGRQYGWEIEEIMKEYVRCLGH